MLSSDSTWIQLILMVWKNARKITVNRFAELRDRE